MVLEPAADARWVPVAKAGQRRGSTGEVAVEPRVGLQPSCPGQAARSSDARPERGGERDHP
ncbi:MAG TPA: hypothetical protein VFM57_00735 [Thermoleophilaceae bacterium]|nr:hypothetical protein [Thermoleophilaceae bacterium]